MEEIIIGRKRARGRRAIRLWNRSFSLHHIDEEEYSGMDINFKEAETLIKIMKKHLKNKQTAINSGKE